mmetsp:Transcript_52054/g.131580  ORF Transcript_52054/g.131580 Transcript_52054/m.131580 type:complete len:215 (-) Transcript_52054:658-1302(-)
MQRQKSSTRRRRQQQGWHKRGTGGATIRRIEVQRPSGSRHPRHERLRPQVYASPSSSAPRHASPNSPLEQHQSFDPMPESPDQAMSSQPTQQPTYRLHNRRLLVDPASSECRLTFPMLAWPQRWRQRWLKAPRLTLRREPRPPRLLPLLPFAETDAGPWLLIFAGELEACWGYLAQKWWRCIGPHSERLCHQEPSSVRCRSTTVVMAFPHRKKR